MKSCLPSTLAPQFSLWRCFTRLALTLLVGATSLVFGVTAPAITITTASLPTATAGTAYATTLNATGGTQPYTWKLVSGGFPDGLALSPGGQIAGLPTASGSWVYSYPFRV